MEIKFTFVGLNTDADGNQCVEFAIEIKDCGAVLQRHNPRVCVGSSISLVDVPVKNWQVITIKRKEPTDV